MEILSKFYLLGEQRKDLQTQPLRWEHVWHSILEYNYPSFTSTICLMSKVDGISGEVENTVPYRSSRCSDNNRMEMGVKLSYRIISEGLVQIALKFLRTTS